MRIMKKAFFHDEFDGYMALRLASSAKNGFLLGIEYGGFDLEYEYYSTEAKAIRHYNAWVRKIVKHPKEISDSEDFMPAPFPNDSSFSWPPVAEWSTFTETSMKRNGKQTKIDLTKGTGAHILVSRLLRLKVNSVALQKATGQPRQCIAAIKAHNTMGTYE